MNYEKNDEVKNIFMSSLYALTEPRNKKFNHYKNLEKFKEIMNC